MSEFTGPLPIAPVLERLTAGIPELRLIGVAADLEAAQRQKAPTTPAAFVLLGADSAGAVTSSTARFRQNLTGRFGVVLALQDYRASQRGGARAADIETLIGQVRAALLKWAHPQANRSPMRLSGSGRVIAYRDSVLWWQDTYEADYRIQR